MALKLPEDILELEAEDESLNVLVFGDSGSGKTPFGASSEKCLILRTEKGTISAQRRGSKAKVWPCPTWQEFDKALKWLQKAGAHPAGIPFDWVTVDSGTSLQTLLLRKILKEEFGKAPSKRDLDIPQIQDHQKWQNEFKRTINELIDLPVNLCMTALPMSIESEDSENGEVEEWVVPQFLGQKGAIAWTVIGMFGAGGRVRLVKKDGEIKQRIDWAKSGPHWGRDRYEAMGRYTYNLTLDELAERVRKSGVK